jgi:hypothetical protein
MQGRPIISEPRDSGSSRRTGRSAYSMVTVLVLAHSCGLGVVRGTAALPRTGDDRLCGIQMFANQR